MFRVAVLGGGVSGLAAAFRLRELAASQPLDVTLYESAPRVGGCVASAELGDALVELGADSLLLNKPAIANLLARLNLTGEVIDQQAQFRGARILHRGKLRPIPPEFRLFAPRSIPALMRSGLFSPMGMLRAAMEPAVPARKSAQDESLASFVTRRLGREVLDRLAQPLIGGIYSADPAKLSMEMTLPEFLHYEREYGSLLRAMRHAAGAVPARLVSLRGGLRTLTDALEQRIGASVRTSERVVRAARFDGRWRVESERDAQLYDAFVCALPAAAAAGVLRDIDGVGKAIGAIACASIATVNLTYESSSVTLPPSTGFVVPACEGRAITAATFASQKYAGRAGSGIVSIRAFIGGALQPELLANDDAALARLAHGEIVSILGFDAQPIGTLVSRWSNLPQYAVGHRSLVREIDEAVSRLPGLEVAGCAMRGVGVPDCVASGEAAAESVFGYLLGAKGAQT